jgi:hypothetical protein
VRGGLGWTSYGRQSTRSTNLTLRNYTDEILRSGCPGMRWLSGRALRTQLDGYVDRISDDADVRHLDWLEEEIGDRLLDKVVLGTGPQAYRRPDGVAVVPLALLDP